MIDTRQGVGGWVFSAHGVQSTLSKDAVEDARGAAYAVRRVVWDGCDWWIVWFARKFVLGEIGYVSITRTVRETNVAG